MSFILGKDVILSVLVDGNYVPICCAKTCKLTTTAEIAGKSTIGSGLWKENKALNMSFTLSSDGITTLDSNTNLYTLRQLQFALQPVQVQFETIQDNVAIVYTATCLIQTVDESGTSNDAGTYNAQFIGTGELLMDLIDLLLMPPDDFDITNVFTPIDGDTNAVTLDWSAVLGATGYLIRIRNVTTGITTYDVPFGTSDIITTTRHQQYYFAIRTNQGTLHSMWSDELYLLTP